MQYIKKSTKSVTEVVENIKTIAPNHKFGVLSTRNMQETLANKGFDLQEECIVMDICNPKVAHTFLSEDLLLSSILPCTVSVFSKDGQTTVVANLLTELVPNINPDFMDLATTTQVTLETIINEAL